LEESLRHSSGEATFSFATLYVFEPDHPIKV